MARRRGAARPVYFSRHEARFSSANFWSVSQDPVRNDLVRLEPCPTRTRRLVLYDARIRGWREQGSASYLFGGSRKGREGS